MKNNNKVSFSKIKTVLDLPNLLEVQLDSFNTFLQKDVPQEKRISEGLEGVFQSIFPIEDVRSRLTLEYLHYRFGRPKYSDEEAQRKGVTFAAPLYATFRLITKEKSEVQDIIEQEAYLGDLPLMTNRGTFIINGVERVVVSQLHRSPGVYFTEVIHPSGKHLFTGKIIPYRGPWIEFSTDVNDLLLVSLDKRRRFPSSMLLRSLIGDSSDENSLSNTGDLARLYFSVKVKRVDASVVGRILAEDLFKQGSQEGTASAGDSSAEILLEAGTEITEEQLSLLKSQGVKEVALLDEKPGTDWNIFYNTIKKDPTRTRREALDRIHLLLRGGLPVSSEAAETLLNHLFFTPNRYDLRNVGRFKINQKLGLSIDPETTTLHPDDVVSTILYLLKLAKGEGSIDDIDHLGNRRVRRVGELLEAQFFIAFSRLARAIRERMIIQDIDTLTPQELINYRLISGVIMAFYTTSQLSQFLEQANPLTELTHKRRLSALGPGGLTRDTAGFEVRDVHHSHYGRICPIETPEGANIGLISSLSTYARVNSLGFILTPYRKVHKGSVTREIHYLSAYEEDQYVVAQANTPLDQNGKILTDKVLARRRGDFPIVSPEDVDYMDVSPKQLVSAAAALIPFLEHDDANRALMGSNMQRQAVPLLVSEPPFVGTGLEERIVRDSAAVVLAQTDGIVEQVTADEIVIQPKEKEEPAIKLLRSHRYPLIKFRRTNQNTCLNQKPIVNTGDTVRKWQVIADGPATSKGELALGSNVLCGFLPWGGYNFEDAIIISEEFLKRDTFTSIYIEEFECQVRETKLGPEEITREIPNVGEDALRNLDEEGIIRIGAEVGPEDILVGKVSPKGETELTPEERLLRAIFGEKAADVRDTSLRDPPGVRGVVIEVRKFSRGLRREADKEVQKEIERLKSRFRDERRKILASAHEELESILGGVLGKTISFSMRNDDGMVVVRQGQRLTDKVLIKLNLLKIVIPEDASGAPWKKTRLLLEKIKEAIQNLEEERHLEIEKLIRGDELPHGVLKSVKVFVAQKRKLSVGDKMAGRHGNKGVVAKIVPEEDMPYLEDGTPVEILLNPLGVPSRMNVGQILETHLGWAAKKLGSRYVSPVFEGASTDEVKDALKKAELPLSGKARLFDGRTGKPLGDEVTVGYLYMMKLSHLVDDKVHARSTGPYSLITQQPLGGKAQFGGQRFGEMEVWALEAYGAAHTLQEILTVKSDDVIGRSKLYESIVKGENPPEPGLPVSFNVLLKELNGLCLDVELE
jgi:DNA-directed RNA polymerase subunit beta